MGTGTLITNSGRLIALNRTFKAVPDYTAPINFEVGIGTATPSPADTALASWTFTKATSAVTFDEPNLNVTTQGVLLTTEANGVTLSEFGLFNADTPAKMMSHAVFMGITKDASVQVIITEKDVIN